MPGDGTCRRKLSMRATILWCALVVSVAGCGRLGFEVMPAPGGGADDAAEPGTTSPGGAVPGALEDGGSAPGALDAATGDSGPSAAMPDAQMPNTQVPDAQVPDAAAMMIPPDDAGSVGLPASTWQRRALPRASGAATSAVLSDGLHYLGGGSDYFSATRYRHHDVYDAVTQTWSATPADAPDSETWGARAHVFQDRLYLLGGFPNGKRLRVYTPSTNSWSSLKAPPRAFEWGFASAVIGNALYAFGGVEADANKADGFKYDFGANSWTKVAPIPQNQGRGPLSSAAVGSRIYVLNGNANDGTTILQIYDSATNTWSTGAALAGHFFEAAATAVVGNQIYFLGGADDQDRADSSPNTPVGVSAAWNIYNTVTNSWSSGAAMPGPKMWATAQIYAGQLHVLGGLDASSRERLDHDVFTLTP